MLGRFLSGLIRIEAEHDFVDETFQDSRLLFSEGSALRRHHVFNSGFKQHDQIELAFADDCAVCFNQSALRFVQTKKNASFLEKRRFGGIQIFRDLRVGFEQTPAKRDHFADIVADGENDSAAETIVNFTARPFFVARFHQTALQKMRARITALERPFQKCVPTVRREAELPVLRDRFVDATAL